MAVIIPLTISLKQQKLIQEQILEKSVTGEISQYQWPELDVLKIIPGF